MYIEVNLSTANLFLLLRRQIVVREEKMTYITSDLKTISIENQRV